VPELVPCPTGDDRAINEPATVSLSPGEQGTVTFTPSQRVTDVRLPVVAVSKAPYTIYQMDVDEATTYGPARIPPTDIDDLQTCFVPALRMRRSLVVRLTRTSAAGNSQTYHIQPVGWESLGGA
jgi:hypothetical protein